MQSYWIRFRFAAALALLGTVAACGSSDSDEEDFGSLSQPLAPGSNAEFVSSTVPLAMAPGEKRNVQVVMRNTGAMTDGSNTWTPAAYSLAKLNNLFGWSSAASPVTPVGGSVNFILVITAPPTPGTYTFAGRMKQDVFFGQQALVPNIVVSNATTPMWRCSYEAGLSNVPTTMTPGENRYITAVVRNTGSATWTSSGFLFKSIDTPTGFWGNTQVALTSNIAANQTASFSFTLKAPTTPGTYSLRRQMQDTRSSGVGLFAAAGCLDTTITVAGPSSLNAALVSQDFPTTMAPGESRVVNVTLNNNGTQAWQANGDYTLYTKNTPASLWGHTATDVSAATPGGSNHTFAFVVTAPATPGSYNHRWQMRKLSGADAGFFGVSIDVPVVVDANATSQYNAVVVSQNIPGLITAGDSALFSITMQNTGTAAWTGSNFGLHSGNSPTSLWGVNSSALGAAETIAANATRTFDINVTAPTTPGVYDSVWQMRQLNGGIGFFGQQATTTGITVTLCGNGIIDAGEVCDDDNLTPGDGCSESCQTEVTEVVDLATDPADRTLVGVQDNKQLANVAIGELTGDTNGDVAVGQNATVVPAGETFRNQAGLVHVYSGAFFGGGAPVATIYGADANDSAGAHNGGAVVIGEVTGAGPADLIISAPTADGPANARSDCGEAYVLAGGSITGAIDLRYAVIAAHITGSTAGGALLALATGDVTGDGVGDLVLGQPGLGSVVVLPGPVSGEIDLATPPGSAIIISGTGAGAAAAVGNIGGNATADLLIGSASSVGSGLSQSGAAWAVFGPITGAINLGNAPGSAGGPNARFFGAGTNDKLGGAVAIGDAIGSTSNDVIIGAIQQRKAGAQVGAVNVWAGPITNGATFNLGTTPATLTILGRDAFDGAGSSVAAGDFNGDGVADIAVGSYSADGPGETRDGAGEVVIVAGRRSGTSTIDLSGYAGLLEVIGRTSRDLMASRVTNLAFGNLDGDTAAEFCVGSPKGSDGSIASQGRIDCFQ
jgi:cysteine-rich repeat protein